MFSVSQLEIGVSARNLKVFKDPNKQLSLRCALLVSNGFNENFIEVDKTEFSEECLNPDWDKRFIIAYKFTEIQSLRFDLYLSVNKIGESKLPLVELLSAKDGYTMKAIKLGNDKIGKLRISFKECQNNKEVVSMQFSAKNLDKKDLFGLSDPYLVISNVDRNGNISEVHKTEVIKQNINPIWNSIRISTKTLCQSNYNMNLRFDCYDWDSEIKIKDRNDYIGSFDTNLDQLINGNPDQNTYELIDAEKLAQNINTYKNSGIIYLDQISVTTGESFLDYLQKGLQLNISFAIDFTSALNLSDIKPSLNGETNDMNEYNIFKSFITGFFQIIKQYNRQNLWTASGFNAFFPNNESNDYYNFKENGFYEDYQQIITEFDTLLKCVKPIKSTKSSVNKSLNFEPIVNKEVNKIEELIGCETNKSSRYSALIIMTSDLTKDCFKNLEDIIQKTNSSPISVLIIDINMRTNIKELTEITKIINNSEALHNRNNIEIISLQIPQQKSNEWKILITKTIRDVLNRIPDQFMKYISNEQRSNGSL